MIKVNEFFIEESTQNKGAMLLVAVDQNGQKWVVAGDYHFPPYLDKYESCFYMQEKEKKK